MAVSCSLFNPPVCVTVVSTFRRDVHGRVSAIHGIFHDVTGQRRAEEASARAYERLEQVSREIAQMRGRISQGENPALIGEWAAGAAQDLNGPAARLVSAPWGTISFQPERPGAVESIAITRPRGASSVVWK